jgi:hypothetical protein
LRCQAVEEEARQKVGDLAESKLFAMIQAGDYRAVAFFLTLLCRDRGYVVPKNALSGETARSPVLLSAPRRSS